MAHKQISRSQSRGSGRNLDGGLSDRRTAKQNWK
jgi:hypothetical protein